MSAEQKAAHDAGDGHDHAAEGPSTREIFFMAATGILALLLVVISMRRRLPADESAELS